MCKYFAKITEIDELLDLQDKKDYSKLNKMVLGGGSNVLFAQDFDGLIIKNEVMGIEIVEEDEQKVMLKVGAGENWHQFVLYCISKGYVGIENLSLIPGNVGASPMQNIGAYGVEIKDLIVKVDCIDINDGSLSTFNNEECDFEYRSSIFKTKYRGEKFISHVHYSLTKNLIFNTSYGAIEQELESMGIEELSIEAISQAVISIRQRKLPNPAEIGNAGSFFKNPVVDKKSAERLQVLYPDIPVYPAGPTKIKLAAGWLIEKAGWKGKRLGNYGVHKNQALVLVNYGGAKGNDINNLANEIQSSVSEKFDVLLEKEVNVV